MSLVSAKCPNCGASIQVDNDRSECFCSFCGSKIQTQEAVNLVTKIDKSSDFQNYLRLAKENAEMSQFEDACSYVDKALEIRPESAKAWMFKAFYTSHCADVEGANGILIEPENVFYDENYKKVLLSGQKAIQYASSDADDTNYASLVYRLFLGIAKGTLVCTRYNASNHEWLLARYRELEDLCYPGQVAHWGQHEHEHILEREDKENIEMFFDALENAMKFFQAVPKSFITPDCYESIKEIANLYVECISALNERASVYNGNLIDVNREYSMEVLTLINSYIPESIRTNDSEHALNNIKHTKNSDNTKLIAIVFFIICIIILVVLIGI